MRLELTARLKKAMQVSRAFWHLSWLLVGLICWSGATHAQNRAFDPLRSFEATLWDIAKTRGLDGIEQYLLSCRSCYFVDEAALLHPNAAEVLSRNRFYDAVGAATETNRTLAELEPEKTRDYQTLVAGCAKLMAPAQYGGASLWDVDQDKAFDACWFSDEAVESWPDDLPANLAGLRGRWALAANKFALADKLLIFAVAEGDLIAKSALVWFEDYLAPKPKEQLLAWGKAAAAQGDWQAMDWLALKLWHSANSQRDFAQALKSFLPQAEEGSGFAQFVLGLAYEQGRGVARSSSKARRWYQRATEAEQPQAYARLAALWLKDGGQSEAEIVDLLISGIESGDLYSYALAVNKLPTVDRSIVRKLQAYLQALELYQLGIDGDFGLGTQAALNELALINLEKRGL